MKKILLAAVVLLGLATPIFNADSVVQADTAFYWYATAMNGADTTGYRARDYGSGDYFQGTWTLTVCGPITAGVITIIAYDLIGSGTSVAIQDSATLTVRLNTSSTTMLSYNDYIIADSVKVFSAVGDTVRLVAVGDPDDWRNVYGSK